MDINPDKVVDPSGSRQVKAQRQLKHEQDMKELAEFRRKVAQDTDDFEEWKAELAAIRAAKDEDRKVESITDTAADLLMQGDVTEAFKVMKDFVDSETEKKQDED